MIENDLFDQNWRTRSKADQVRYVVLKWTFCFAIGILTGIVGFVINLAVENVAGFKHAAVSALMESSRCCSLLLPCIYKKYGQRLLNKTNGLYVCLYYVHLYSL